MTLAKDEAEAALPAFQSEEAFLRRCEFDFEFFCVHVLKIRVTNPLTRRIEFIPFVLSPEQRSVARWITFCISQNIDIRVIIAKCRKLGMSTLVEGLGFWLCCFRSGFRAAVIAHKSAATQQIALINKTYNRSMSPALAAVIGGKEAYNNLLWPKDWGSIFECMTQGSTDATRGGDRSFMHLSELAFWDADRKKSSAEDVLGAIVGDEPWALIVESTSNGMAGAFYSRFTSTWADWHNIMLTTKVWKPFFFTWVGVPRYSQRAGNRRRAAHDEMVRVADTDLQRSEKIAQELGYGAEWLKRTLEFDLTASQVSWALSKLRDFNGDLKKFDQEFPITWQMSFISSGRQVFDQYLLKEWMAQGLPEGSEMFDRLIDDECHGTGAGQEWHIYEKVDPLEEYIVGGDSSSGGGDGCDYATLAVFARRAQRFVAQFYSDSCDPSELAVQAVHIATYYNEAYLIPEIDNHGYATVQRILDLGYRKNLHNRQRGKPVRAGTQKKWSQKFGWKATTENKKRTVQSMKMKFSHQTFHDPSPRTHNEMTTFVFDSNDKPDHMAGKFDDAITSARLALEADDLLRAPKPLTELTGKPQDAISRAMSNWSKKAEGKRPRGK